MASNTSLKFKRSKTWTPVLFTANQAINKRKHTQKQESQHTYSPLHKDIVSSLSGIYLLIKMQEIIKDSAIKLFGKNIPLDLEVAWTISDDEEDAMKETEQDDAEQTEQVLLV